MARRAGNSPGDWYDLPPWEREQYGWCLPCNKIGTAGMWCIRCGAAVPYGPPPAEARSLQLSERPTLFGPVALQLLRQRFADAP